MPGSILVSVLEAVDLPVAAEEGELVSVKVSVGKTEFQTSSSKADSGKTTPWNLSFSFPVLNLRDNLVVTLIGNKGEEIAKNEVDTSSIVERGFCDEFLSLKGGGSIHLRLSFVLTEEERQRIEMMRAAALRRKDQELVRLSSNNQMPQLMEELRTSSTGPIPTMAESTREETSKANTEHILAGVAGKAVEGTELKDPIAIQEIKESPLSSSETSDSKSLTPNSVKDRVKALERSISQDSGKLSQSLLSQVGNLQRHKSAELMKFNAARSTEVKEKPSEEESLIKETSRKVAAEKSQGREYYAFVSGEQNKNANPVGILDVAKQVLSGAAMVTVAVLIWTTAANSNRRRTNITQKRRRKT